jgi:hypothetical protein
MFVSVSKFHSEGRSDRSQREPVLAAQGVLQTLKMNLLRGLLGNALAERSLGLEFVG